MIRAVHITELRTRIDAMWVRFELSALRGPTHAHAGRDAVGTVHITELHTALAQAYTATGQPPPTYMDPVDTPGATVV